jgi:four helix bundle protein
MEKPRQSGFRQVTTWQRAEDLASAVLPIIRSLPRTYDPLPRQLFGAALSVPANIAEGYGRTLKDYLRFLEIAGGSLNEVENYLHFIARNELLTPDKIETAEDLRYQTGALLFRLRQSLSAKLKHGEPWQRGFVREESEPYLAAGE